MLIGYQVNLTSAWRAAGVSLRFLPVGSRSLSFEGTEADAPDTALVAIRHQFDENPHPTLSGPAHTMIFG